MTSTYNRHKQKDCPFLSADRRWSRLLDSCRMLPYKIIMVCVIAFVAMDAASIPNSGDVEVNYRLSNDAKPIMYEIKLNPHLVPNDFAFDGEMSIHVHILNSTNIITLHMKKLVIIEIATYLKSMIELGFHVPIAHERNNQIRWVSVSDRICPPDITFYIWNLVEYWTICRTVSTEAFMSTTND